MILLTDTSLSQATIHYCSPFLNSFTLTLAPQTLPSMLSIRVLHPTYDRYAKLDDGSPFSERTRLASQLLDGWLQAVFPHLLHVSMVNMKVVYLFCV